MAEREQTICLRLKQFRLAKTFSQLEFAKISGISPAAYIGYEYARAQLNYPAAWRILKAFPSLNPAWLAGENAPREEIPLAVYPTPAETGLGPRTAFSVVYDKLLKQIILNSRPHLGANLSNPFLVTTDAAGRIAAGKAFGELVKNCLGKMPDQKVNGFLNALHDAALKELTQRSDQHDPKAVGQRQREMLEIEKRQLLAYFGNAPADDLKKEFDTISKLGNNPAVKAKLPALIKRLNEATKDRGTKTALAKFIGVSLPKISQWLSGEHEPGGETTLRLLQWVEQQERQK